jgi:hypothetical protein
MNTAVRQYRLHLRNWQLLLISFLYPGLVLAAALFGLHETGQANQMTLMVLIVTVSSTAFFLASAQKEMLHRSATFLLPGFRRCVLQNQAATGLVVGASTFLLSYLFPMTHGLQANNLVHAWSFAFLAVGLFAVVLFLVFRFPYSSFLPFVAFWLVFLFIKVWIGIPGERIAAILSHGVLISAATGLILYLVGRDMMRVGLHRKLIEQPYISIVDLKNPAKTEQFKQAMAQRKNRTQSCRRPWAHWISGAAEYAGRARAAGQDVKAGVWEAIAHVLVTSIPRSRVWLTLVVLSLPLMILAMGIYDTKVSARSDLVMTGWFPGLVFGLSYAPSLLFFPIKSRPLGQLRSRVVLEKTGYLGTLVILATGISGAVVTWFLFKFTHLVLPKLALGDLVLHSGMPRLHTLFLPLMVTPVVLLVTTLWRNKGTMMVPQQTGTLTFFLVHGLFHLLGSDMVLWPVVGTTTILWLVLPFVWHWRVWKTDLA